MEKDSRKKPWSLFLPQRINLYKYIEEEEKENFFLPSPGSDIYIYQATSIRLAGAVLNNKRPCAPRRPDN